MKQKFFTTALQFLLFLPAATLYAEEEAPAPARDFSQTIIMFGIIGLFFYFIIWRPEQRRRKALELQRTTLKKGDRVTAMGMLGTIIRVDDQTVIVRMYDGAKIEFLKGAISEVHPESSTVTIDEIKDKE